MRKGLFWEQPSSLERLLALMDGIYAIVLTLLVIPNFIAYLIFFGGCDFLDEESLDSQTTYKER